MSSSRPAVSCVLFDLDGTLLDTAPDMGRALNRLLIEQGRAALPADEIRPMVSHGSTGLLRLGFGIGPDAANFVPLRDRFLALYGEQLNRETRLFPGMDAVLEVLDARKLPWGVVTNKPAFLTMPLLTELALARRAACVVSGDTLIERKPHPAPLLYACSQVGVAPAECIYVGDAARDVTAGRRAGMTTVVARYGYIGAGERPGSWGANGQVESPIALLDWLE